MASSAARRSGPTISVARSPSRILSTIERKSEVSRQLHQPHRVDLEAAQQLPHHRGDVRPQPRHAAELQRVRDLVERDPAQQLVGLGVERRRRHGEVGRHEQQPRGRLGLEDRELVLAEHALGEHPRHRADLDGQQRARGRADRAGERAHALAELVGHRVEHRLERVQVALDPQRPVDRLGVRQRVGLQAGVGGDEPGGLLSRPGDVLERGRLGGGLEVRDALRDGGCELPIDHGIQGGSRV